MLNQSCCVACHATLIASHHAATVVVYFRLRASGPPVGTSMSLKLCGLCIF